jgi:Family of unknown function (DUF5675)
MGELSIDGSFQCYTLEPPHRDGDTKPRAIPAGRYRLTWRFSKRHQKDVPHVEDVPGFTEIEIHAGNYPKDTEGCLLLGRSRGPDYLSTSVDACDQVYARVEACVTRDEEMFITYLDPQPQAEGV